MEKIRKGSEKKGTDIGGLTRNITLALGLSLGISNFLYSQENGRGKGNTIEQNNESKEKNIDEYKIKVANRNNNIINNTSETLDEYVARLQRQFEYETNKNMDTQKKIDEIKNILNNKYSQNITNNDPFFIIQTALKTISNSKKYGGLSLYSNKFSGKFDLNFVDALGYVQYINDLHCIGTLSGKNGENTLNKIIYDLNSIQKEQIIQDNPFYNGETGIRDQEISNPKIQIIERQETVRVTINDHTNRIKSVYATKIENRNNNIIHHTSETLDDFVQRMSKQFEFELKDKNSLISKKILSIKELLNNKYNYQLDDSPIIVVESALKVLSKNGKYQGLQEYSNKFSGKFDLNFIDAYGFFQYQNDGTCSWSISGKNGALLLQSIYDELQYINTSNNYVVENTKNADKNPNVTEHNSNDIIIGGINNTEISQDVTSNIEPENIEMEGIALLSNNLSLDKLNGVTYEDVWNTVNSFKHEGLRNAVMDRLLHNDIIGAQRLLGMDLNCDSRLYPDYVAGKKLGQRELKLMEKHSEYRRYMDSQEFLNNMEKVERAYEIENYEVKTAYLKFLSGEFDNGGLPYCIISKYDYKIYLFSADHKYLASYPVVTGAHEGNHPNDVGEHLRDPYNAHHTTPGGMYKFGGFFDKSLAGKNLTVGFGTHFGTFEPMEGQYIYSDECALGIHGFVKGREWMFYSQEMKNRLASNGCINFLRNLFGDLYNHLKIGSKIYICRDDEISNVGGLGYNKGEIEMIEHFGRKPKNVIHWNAVVNSGYCKNNTWNTTILPRKILSRNSVVKDGYVGSELPHRYNLNLVTTSSKTNIYNTFRQCKKQPYNQMYQKKYVS